VDREDKRKHAHACLAVQHTPYAEGLPSEDVPSGNKGK